MPSRLRRFDIPGHSHFWTISCYRRLSFFWHDSIKQVAVDGLRCLQAQFRVCLVAYVIMPEHVHVILYPHERDTQRLIPISDLLESFKTYVGNCGIAQLRKLRQQYGKLWSPPIEGWASSNESLPFWTTRGYDFNIDRMDTLLEKVTYCHKNPVTRGLVKSPDEWRWSSFRFYELQDPSGLQLDWDGAWPIVW